MSSMSKKEDPQIIEGKVFAILSYLSIFCIIPLLFKKDNPFVLSHGKQGLVLFVCEAAVFILHIAFGVWLLKFGTFVLGVLSFVGIVNVLMGRYVRLPFVASAADKISL